MDPPRSSAIAPLCHKSEHFSTERVGSGGEQAFILYSGFVGRIEPQEIHHDMSNDGEVVGSKSGAHAGLVFIELDIQTPVELVFYLPVTFHRTRNTGRIGGKAADVIGALNARTLAHGALAFDHGKAAQVLPLLVLVKPIDCIVGPAAAGFDAAVVVLCQGDFIARSRGQFPFGIKPGEQDRIEQTRMIVLHAQHIVRLALADRLGDLGLSPHRVDGHDRAFERQGLEQLGDSGYFVGFLRRGGLSQHHSDTRRKGADQVQRMDVGVLFAGRAATRLPVDGYDRAVGRNAIFKLHEAAQPIEFRLGPETNGDKVVGATEHRAHHDGQELR